MTEKEEEFITKYEALCREYGLYLRTCGCCNSPWVSDYVWSEGSFELTLEKEIEHLRSNL